MTSDEINKLHKLPASPLAHWASFFMLGIAVAIAAPFFIGLLVSYSLAFTGIIFTGLLKALWGDTPTGKEGMGTAIDLFVSTTLSIGIGALLGPGGALALGAAIPVVLITLICLIATMAILSYLASNMACRSYREHWV